MDHEALGLVDHDGTPSWKVDEFASIASEFATLSKFGFPRYTHPEVAIAYSFDSFIDSDPNGPSNTTLQYFKPPYTDQVQAAFEPLFRANIDTAIINIGHDALSSYKLVVVPGDYVMDAASAKALRAYVSGGGVVLMCAMPMAAAFTLKMAGRCRPIIMSSITVMRSPRIAARVRQWMR